MKRIATHKGLEIVQRGKKHLTYEIWNGGKVQATFPNLDDLYASIERRERRINWILNDPRLDEGEA